MQSFINRAKRALGVEPNTTSHLEKLLSAMGTFLSIVACSSIIHYLLPANEANILIASMGASAILVFAIPHGALSQPWPMVMGHLISAFIGIACYQSLGDNIFSISLAVSLSVVLMYYAHCLHPPGGATAFFVVTADTQVHAMGYDLMTSVVLLNILCILLCAIIFNNVFSWRRYPAYFAKRVKPTPQPPFSQEALNQVLHDLNSFVDMGHDELLEILSSVLMPSNLTHEPIHNIVVNRFYSNGLLGEDWQIYQVLALSPHNVSVRLIDSAIIKDEVQVMDKPTFLSLVKYEVVKHDQVWLKKHQVHIRNGESTVANPA